MIPPVPDYAHAKQNYRLFWVPMYSQPVTIRNGGRFQIPQNFSIDAELNLCHPAGVISVYNYRKGASGRLDPSSGASNQVRAPPEIGIAASDDCGKLQAESITNSKTDIHCEMRLFIIAPPSTFKQNHDGIIVQLSPAYSSAIFFIDNHIQKWAIR